MWLLLACKPDPAPATTPETSTDTSTVEDTAFAADTVPEVTQDIPAAALSAEAVIAAIEDTFADGMPSPLLPRKSYLEMFQGRDDNCPGGQGYNLPGAFQGCTSDDGWLYAGIAEYEGPTDPEIEGNFGMLADCYMVDPDGNWFVAAGEMLFDKKGDLNGGSVTAEISGTWSYAPAGSWMAPEGAGAVLEISAEWSDYGWSIALDGSATNGTNHVRLEMLSMSNEACSGAAVSGRYELRGADGYWYSIDATDCGCGSVTWADGSVLGEGCVDLTSAMSTLLETFQ